MILYYIRHGEPIYNPDCLTTLGKKQADALSKRLAVCGIDRIYSSPSTRAYETAIPTSKLTGVPITKLDFLHEDCAWEYFTAPDADGRTVWVDSLLEYRKMFVSREVYELGDKWYEYSEFPQNNFAAGVDFFSRKTDELLLSLGYKHDREHRTYTALCKNNERVAVFAHGGVGGAFFSSVLDIPYPQFIARYALSHTGVVIIEFNDNKDVIIPRVLQFGNDAHLYKEGLII